MSDGCRSDSNYWLLFFFVTWGYSGSHTVDPDPTVEECLTQSLTSEIHIDTESGLALRDLRGFIYSGAELPPAATILQETPVHLHATYPNLRKWLIKVLYHQ